MKKFPKFMLCLSAAFTLAACSASSSTETSTAADSADTASTEERTTLTVGFDAEFPPYGFKDGDDYTGFDLDLAQEVADYYDWELIKQPIDWDAKDMELSSGAIDCIWNGFTINGREDQYTWTAPYIDNSQVIVVKADSGISSFDDLAGKTLDVQKDSSALAALTGADATDLGKEIAEKAANLVQIGDYNAAFMDLDAGACDAIAMDIGVAQYQIASRDGDYVILEPEFATEQYGIGFKLGNTELRDQVETALKELEKDGTVDTVIEKWMTIDNGAYSDLDLANAWCFAKD